MSEKSAYARYQLHWYRAPIPILWWLRRRSYFVFVLRELSCVFVAWSVVFLLLLIYSVSQGEDTYQRFLDRSANPWVVLLNLVALLFVVFHAITWFNLAPKAIVVRLRGRRVPPRLIAASQYVAWAVVSALLAWLLVAA
jgi:fumarate reductase subunit C